MDPDALILLRKVADRSPSEREAYYDQHAVSAEAREQVEALLKAGDRTLDSFAGHVASFAVRALLEEQRTPPAPSRTLLRPATISRYQVIRPIGRGGMSEVYLARDPMLERDIAVKLIAGDLDDDAARRRLVREAGAAGRLRHPNIVTIFDAGEHEGQPYIAMEYVAGETLRSLIRRQDPLPLRRRLELIEGACAGLAHAHRNGVVHLDIKPDNLIVDETGVVKVLDFGIARVLTGDSLATRHVVGTLRYMSPEQVAGDLIDHRSDIFSLGSSLYELLTYLPAFAGSTKEIIYQISTGPVPRLMEVMPEADARLDAAVSRAMALEPDDRFADIDEFRAELARLREELDPSGNRRFQVLDPGHAKETRERLATVVETPAQTSRERLPGATTAVHRPRAALALGIAAIAVPLAAGVWLLRPGSAPESRPAATNVSTGAPAAAIVREPEAPAEPLSAGNTADTNEVWRRLALDDRQGVIAFLQSRPTDAASGPAERLPYDVLSAVNKSVAQSRATAAGTPGAASSPAYGLAEERLGSAKRLEAAGDPIGALRRLWEASDLYVRSLNDRGRQAPVPSTTLAPTPVAEAGVATPPPALPSSRAAVQPLPPQSLPSTRPAAVASGRPPTEGRSRRPSDADGVVEALGRYRSAYQARDVSQVLQVFPSLRRDQIEQLRKTFDGVAAYDIEIEDPRVQIQADVATARARVVRRMTPRVGSEVSNEVETTFSLRRTGGGWEITDVSAQ